MVPATLSIDIVLFAIRSAVKLGHQVRSAYVDSLRNKALVMPFINFPSEPDFIGALSFFEDKGSSFIENDQKLKKLYDKAAGDQITEDSVEGQAFMLSYQELWAQGSAERSEFLESGLDGQNILDLMQFRQWIRGNEKNPTALQRIAGTLVEIGVDYFTNVPGALRENSAHSMAVKGFLTAIDDVNFAESRMDLIAQDLFVAAIESISDNPDLLSGDKTTQELITAVSKGLITDVENKIKALEKNGPGNLAKQEKIQAWAKLVFRSVLSNSGRTVLSNPGKFLNVREGGKSKMITAVGDAVLNGLIDDDGVDVENLFNKESIDSIVKAALATLAEHPELIEIDNEGLKNIIKDAAKDLSDTSQAIDPDLLPEVIRLILEKSSKSLDLIWPEIDRGEKKYLLITAAKETLSIISRKPDGTDKYWRPHLTKDDARDVLETVFDEVLQNPDWIMIETNDVSPVLKDALEGAFQSLNKIPSKYRFTQDALKNILRSSIKAVALRRQFIEIVPIEETGDKKYLITFVLDTIFDLIFKKPEIAKARWVAGRSNVISILVDTVLNKLAIEGVSEELTYQIKQVLEDAMVRYKNGKRFSLEEIKNKIISLEI